jgi:pimeloyl-ACP methyl ester carboxylesterase
VVFGHSYSGLVALETSVRSDTFEAMVLYEPGVSVGGSIPTAWMAPYRALLEQGDARGAFACFVQAFGAGPVAKLPLWYLRAVLRGGIRKRRWVQRYEPLLAATWPSTNRSPPATTTSPATERSRHGSCCSGAAAARRS